MSHDDLQLDLLPEFDFDDFAAAEQTRASDQRQATALRTRARINARRAKSEAHLAEILPAQIDDGDAWHVLSAGDVDSLSYLAHLLKTQRMDYVMLSTWCMAAEDVARHWVIESSANINTNPRAENTIITADAGLYQHHLAYFNGVRSFARDFDDWTPP